MNNSLEPRDIMSLAKQKHIPISVLIEVCYACNEDCRHCFLDNRQDVGLGLNYYKSLADQLVDAGTMFVILTGGDPFMHPDFLEIIKIFRKKRISVSIFTNGTLITKEIAIELVKLCVNEVHISLYGGRSETHDYITRRTGSFDQSVQTIKMLKSLGVVVRIKSPLMRETAGEVELLKSLSKKLSVDVQYTTTITAKDSGDKSTHKHQIEDEQLRALLIDSDINPISRKSVRIENHLDCIPCDTVFNAGSIDPQGNVYTCNQMRICGGNVKDTPFREIWSKSKNFCDLRKIRISDLHKCKNCDLFQFCTRCPGLARLEDGDILGCSSSAKRLAEIRKELKIYPTQRHIFSDPIPKQKGGDEK